jgi:competence protein ComEC
MTRRMADILAAVVRMPDALRLAGPALLSFAFGCGALQVMPFLPSPAPAAIAGAVLVVLAGLGSGTRLPAGAVRWLLVLAALPTGWAYSAWRAEHRLADVLPLALERQDIRVVGVVAELPREFDRGSRFLFRVEHVEMPAAAAVPGRLLLSWHRVALDEQAAMGRAPEPGDRLRLTVRLKRPHGHVNPGGFDYEAWLLERGVRATGYVRATPSPEVLGRLGFLDHPLVGIEGWRSTIRRTLQRALDASAWGGVVIALAIGDQGSIAPEAWRVFAATGTTHLMSISGLHVTMFAALAGGLIGALWRRLPPLALRLPAQRAAILAGTLAAFAYTLLAGAGVPALRTLLMLSVAALAHLSRRSVPVSRVLSLALIAVLLFDPWAVLAVGFWLSFGAVAVLLLLIAPGDGERPTIVQRLRHWSFAQWAVTVGTLPVLLWSFQQVSLASPLANAVAIPLIGMVVSPLAVAAGLVPIDALAMLPEWLLRGLMHFLEALAGQPWALWRQPQPALWASLLAGAGILAHLVAWRQGGSGWRRWAPLVLVAPALWPVVDRPAQGSARIDVLDVGHGLSVIVRTANHALLFDGGPRYSAESNAGERIVVPVSRAAGIESFSGVVLSHRDSDHAGGIESALRELPAGWFASSLPADHPIVAARASPLRCQSGQQWTWDGVGFEFLSPPAGYYDNPRLASNRMSCVLRVRSAAGRTMLLTADAEAPEEAAMLKDFADRFPVDVVQVPHQGSRSSSSEAFVRALAPAYAIVPAGYRNAFGHPHAEVVDRYVAAGARVYRTDLDGAVRIDLGSGVTVGTARAERPRYWHGR